MKDFCVLNEVSEDTLAKIALAAIAGVATVVGGKHLYKKYKEDKVNKKYLEGSQDDKKKDYSHVYRNPYMTSLEPSDITSFSNHFIDSKRSR